MTIELTGSDLNHVLAGLDCRAAYYYSRINDGRVDNTENEWVRIAQRYQATAKKIRDQVKEAK